MYGNCFCLVLFIYLFLNFGLFIINFFLINEEVNIKLGTKRHSFGNLTTTMDVYD